MDTAQTLTAILLTPLVSAGLIALFFRRGGYLAAAISVLAALIIAVLSLRLIFGWDGETVATSWSWLTFGSYDLSIGYLLTPSSVLMLFIVSFIGFWIHVFSVGYMNDDENKGRFFGGLSIFMFSMLGIVLADNLFMIFIFWELVGFSSYMLIAHYWDKDFAAAASKKAFIVNRIGDFGFLIGIAWAYNYYGTASLEGISTAIQTGAKDPMTGIGLLLMCGFLGKSAQFPLQVWLTDAMAGPTPVSALIHAATMVAAGIFFMVRVFFILTPFTLEWIMWSGALMALLAGLWALGQTDIKKTLAYSTLSHLGYMAVALGLGLPGLAMMHLAMHACFKATLFLCAGSVIHGCHHEQDMFKMGGLYKKMPVTATAFLFATLSIMAIPYFAGYYSKDTIINAAYALGSSGFGGQYYWIYGITLAGAFLTALYMGRMFWVVFCGKPRSEHAAHAHESNLWMTLPLIILGVLLSLGAGWFTLGHGHGAEWLGDKMNGMLPTVATTFMLSGYGHSAIESLADASMYSSIYGLGYNEAHALIVAATPATLLEIVALVLVILGVIATYFFYGRSQPTDRLQRTAPALYGALEKHGWFDDVYDCYVAKVQQPFANFIAVLDSVLISGLLVRGSAGLAGLIGMVARSLHTGNLQTYVYWFLAGLVLFGAFALGLL